MTIKKNTTGVNSRGTPRRYPWRPFVQPTPPHSFDAVDEQNNMNQSAGAARKGDATPRRWLSGDPK